MEKVEKTTIKESSVKIPDKTVVRKAGKSKTPWQRLVLSLIGISIMLGMWRWATYHLYSLPSTSIVAFTSITNNTQYTIAALVIFFVTGRLIYEWKNSTATSLIDSAQHISQDVTERRDLNEKIDSTNTNINIDADFRSPELIDRYENK